MHKSKMFDLMAIEAPSPERRPTELAIHGDQRIDNYYWLKEREDANVVDYLNKENNYRENVMAHLKPFEEKLFEEIKGRIKQDDSSVPYFKNGYYYLTRFEANLEYPVYARKKGSLKNDEQVMLNVNDLAQGHAYYNVGGMSVSENNRLITYGEDTLGRRIYTLKFKDLHTGEMLEDEIPNTTGSAVWANDNLTVFYAQKDKTLRSYRILSHVLGTPVSEDKVVFTETDPTFSCYVWKSKSRQFIMIGSFQSISTEIRFLDANDPKGTFTIIEPRSRNHEYRAYHFGNHWYILTNWNAKNFKVMRTSLDTPSKKNWEEYIEHRTDVLIEGLTHFDQFIVLNERHEGISKVSYKTWQGTAQYIDFGEETYTAHTSTNPEFSSEIVRISYTSLTTPNSTLDFNMRTGQLKVMKEQEVVGDFKKSDYSAERIMVEARDGTEIPVSIVYRKGYKMDGNGPLLLYSYGAYGISSDPYFSSVRLSLLDRGFAFAIAHIRGGQELGRHWYEEGKLLKKKNTFTDFIDCAEHLITKGYTKNSNLYGMGGSAGGLLMGAVVNMRPELWNGIVAAVPFVDVVTTMLDETIPLTTGEYDEWGNPNDPLYYSYIKSYSPYDNVEKKEYPPMLVTTGFHDSQVQYWEPAKWVAKMRELKTDTNPLLLYCNMETGHGGSSGRFQRLREVAMEYAFLLDLAGLADVE